MQSDFNKLKSECKGGSRKVPNFSSIIGLISGIISILLWVLLIFFNPYSEQFDESTVLITLFCLVLPAIIAILSFYKSINLLMLLAFISSLPLSLYLLMTPGVFLIFGFTCLAYLISYILMVLTKRNLKSL